jgi:hypothetical protein
MNPGIVLSLASNDTFNYTLCGQWPKPSQNEISMFVWCAAGLPPVRYVAIVSQMNYLGICELEVYGRGNVSFDFQILEQIRVRLAVCAKIIRSLWL